MQMNIYATYFILLLESLSKDVSKFKMNNGIVKNLIFFKLFLFWHLKMSNYIYVSLWPYV